MEKQPTTKNDPLADALKLIDPTGTLVPGTKEHETVSYMLQGWIDQNGTDKALCMARMCRKHLGRWRKFL
jgi:hypothetical protein